VHKGDFRLTANQNVIIAGVDARRKKAIQKLVNQYGLGMPSSGLRRHAMACVALPTCGLALAESERYMPDLVTALEGVLIEAGLAETDIVIRMTGCPNGCARPYLAEIGLVGRAPGKYNLYLGAAFDGSRLNKLYRQDVGHDEIVGELTPLFQAYARDREEGERFGDFVIRQGLIAASGNGAAFHDDVVLEAAK
jgi:sulfite reductase (NADPH) hemoprotein beta-component